MTRPLDAATAASLEKAVVPVATFVRLDIDSDPLYCWSGIGSYTPAGTGDTAFDGYTFAGVGTLMEVGTVVDSIGGSDTLELSMSGVNLNDPLMRQVITNRNRWQFKKAYVWMQTLDETGAFVGKPFRVKTGHIDQMPFGEDNSVSYIKCRIEGQQSYGNQPLATRYSEQLSLNSNDNSQTWCISLANMTAALGQPSAVAPVPSFPGGGSWQHYIPRNAV